MEHVRSYLSRLTGRRAACYPITWIILFYARSWLARFPDYTASRWSIPTSNAGIVSWITGYTGTFRNRNVRFRRDLRGTSNSRNRLIYQIFFFYRSKFPIEVASFIRGYRFFDIYNLDVLVDSASDKVFKKIALKHGKVLRGLEDLIACNHRWLLLSNWQNNLQQPYLNPCSLTHDHVSDSALRYRWNTNPFVICEPGSGSRSVSRGNRYFPWKYSARYLP